MHKSWTAFVWLWRQANSIFRWWGLMSGGLSIPFTFLAIFGGLSQRKLFLILAYLSLLVLIVSLTMRVTNLLDKQKSKLRVTYDEDKWCKTHETRTGGTPFIFLRLAVTNDGLDEITDCKGHLVAVENE